MQIGHNRVALKSTSEKGGALQCGVRGRQGVPRWENHVAPPLTYRQCSLQDESRTQATNPSTMIRAFRYRARQRRLSQLVTSHAISEIWHQGNRTLISLPWTVVQTGERRRSIRRPYGMISAILRNLGFDMPRTLLLV